MKRITSLDQVPDLDAMSDEELVEWAATHDIALEIDRLLFPKTTLDEDLEAVGLSREVVYPD